MGTCCKKQNELMDRDAAITGYRQQLQLLTKENEKLMGFSHHPEDKARIKKLESTFEWVLACNNLTPYTRKLSEEVLKGES